MTRIALRAIGLAAWCAFFVWLWVSGESARYLGPRTYWVIPFGALTLGLAAAAHAPLLRCGMGRATNGDGVALGILLAPMLLVVAVPSPELGALAASRRASFGGGGGPVLAVPIDSAGDQISFAELQQGSRSATFARRAGLVEGRIVSLTGFVTGIEGGRISLTRFYVSCCAADAVPYTAEVLASRPTGYEEGQWLRVRGRIATASDGGYAVEAVMIEPVQEPADPYL